MFPQPGEPFQKPRGMAPRELFWQVGSLSPLLLPMLSSPGSPVPVVGWAEGSVAWVVGCVVAWVVGAVVGIVVGMVVGWFCPLRHPAVSTATDRTIAATMVYLFIFFPPKVSCYAGSISGKETFTQGICS